MYIIRANINMHNGLYEHQFGVQYFWLLQESLRTKLSLEKIKREVKHLYNIFIM